MISAEEENIRLAREHLAAESAHAAEPTLATVATDVTYRVVAAGVVQHGQAEVALHLDHRRLDLAPATADEVAVAGRRAG